MIGDVKRARQAGAPVANNGGANSAAVAEYYYADPRRLQAPSNSTSTSSRQVGVFGDLGEQRVHELAAKMLGIVGPGRIGKRVARRAPASI